MPLPLRRVEPVHVSRGTLPERFPVQNDLEAVANGTLSNVIVQLSSLSHQAEELFENLIRVESGIATRANNLQARIDRLAVKVVQMDGNQEELGSMQEALNTKPFQSSMSFDQQVVSRPSMPAAMNKTYIVCDKPPPLDKLNGYRDDGKDGLKFYTDPNYFFELWRQEMLKDTDKAVKKPHKPKPEGGHKQKRVRQPPNTRKIHRDKVIQQGEHIMQGQEYSRLQIDGSEVPDNVYHQQDQNSAMQPRQSVARPSSIELKDYSSGYSESPYGNGVDINSRGDFRPNHLQHHNSAILNRTISQNQYDYDAYNNQVHNNQSQHHRYYSQHVTPPPAYSDVSSPSPNAYSISSRYSGGPTGVSTPNRNGSISINVTPNASMTNGYGFRPSQPPPAPPPNYAGTPPSSHSGTPTRGTRTMNSRETLPPPPPPPTDTDQNHINGGHHQNGNPSMPPPPPMNHEDEGDDPLPPPPPPPDSSHHHMMNNSVENLHLAPSPELVPPPPPPPPMNDNLNINNLEKSNLVSNGGVVKKHVEKKLLPAPAWDGRSELLKAIRDGIELRKVETKKDPNSKEEKASGTYCDVASILARRVAVEMSDSDTGSDSEYDSDQWDEASA